MNGVVLFNLVSGSSMEEHLLAQVFMMEPTGCPLSLLFKVGISIQLLFCFPHFFLLPAFLL